MALECRETKRSAPDAACLAVEVTGDVGKVRRLHSGYTALHIVVELVVAQGGQVIACGIHQFDDGGPLIHPAVGGTLVMVPGVHKQDIFQGFLVSGNRGIGQVLVDVGVHIIGVEDGDAVLLRGGRSHCKLNAMDSVSRRARSFVPVLIHIPPKMFLSFSYVPTHGNLWENP